jgi:hypothetical protein
MRGITLWNCSRYGQIVFHRPSNGFDRPLWAVFVGHSNFCGLRLFPRPTEGAVKKVWAHWKSQPVRVKERYGGLDCVKKKGHSTTLCDDQYV